MADEKRTGSLLDRARERAQGRQVPSQGGESKETPEAPATPEAVTTEGTEAPATEGAATPEAESEFAEAGTIDAMPSAPRASQADKYVDPLQRSLDKKVVISTYRANEKDAKKTRQDIYTACERKGWGAVVRIFPPASKDNPDKTRWQVRFYATPTRNPRGAGAKTK